ncbi:hypothetical protein O6H91_19G046000 [Diphasiastrum complanatum]|uniref:Uncharacterized protein n=1 Tax=Diphasiastrum complanatum TaxID=34168 RepID=A0ACC2AUT3_DIPCM|nr:hypothetical protein O6H91_19G046000 [Diphasiastrum complanatum]
MRRSELMSKGLRLLLRSQFSHLGCRSADISGWNGGNLQLLVPCRNTQVSSFSSIWGSVGAGSLCFTQPMLAASSKEQEGTIVDGNVEAMIQSSSEVQRIHGEMLADMKQLKMPPMKKLTLLLQECSTTEDVKLALDILTHLRSFRAAQCKQTRNFSEHLSELLFQSCIRAKAPEHALRILWRHNVHGLTPDLGIAHKLLGYAKEQGDLALMQQTLKTMVSNAIRPTTKTADIVLRLCKEKGDISLMLKLAKEFHVNGVKLHQALYDICISSVANTGNAKKVHEIQEWRHKFGLSHTTASSFALAKAFVMKKKPQKAASIIYNHCRVSTNYFILIA